MTLLQQSGVDVFQPQNLLPGCRHEGVLAGSTRQQCSQTCVIRLHPHCHSHTLRCISLLFIFTTAASVIVCQSCSRRSRCQKCGIATNICCFWQPGIVLASLPLRKFLCIYSNSQECLLKMIDSLHSTIHKMAHEISTDSPVNCSHEGKRCDPTKQYRHCTSQQQQRGLYFHARHIFTCNEGMPTHTQSMLPVVVCLQPGTVLDCIA